MKETEWLMLSTSTEMVRLREESIVCITSDGNYSHICAIGGDTFIVSSQLGQIEQLIGEQLHSSYGFCAYRSWVDYQHAVSLLYQHLEAQIVFA